MSFYSASLKRPANELNSEHTRNVRGSYWDDPGRAQSGDRFASGFRPKKICQFFLEGRCNKGDNCSFAHSEDELHPTTSQETDHIAKAAPSREDPLAALSEVDLPDMPNVCISSVEAPRTFEPSQPTRLCMLWLEHPTYCSRGDACPDAHGLAEMDKSVNTTAIISKISTAQHMVGHAVSAGGVCHGAKGGFIWNEGSGGTTSYPPPHPGSFASKGMASKGGFGKCKGGSGKGYGSKGFDGGKAAFAALPATSDALQAGRFASDFKPVKMCSFWVQDPSMCTKGTECTFAHGVQELRPEMVATCGVSRFLHMGFKPAKVCNFFQQGACTKGLQCTFAHAPEEL